MKISHFFGFHNPLTCKTTGNIKFEYQSAFDLSITKYTQYQCECGRKFWMPPYSFDEWKMETEIYQMMKDTIALLIKDKRVEEAIELLKLK